jgi:dodecin
MSILSGGQDTSRAPLFRRVLGYHGLIEPIWRCIYLGQMLMHSDAIERAIARASKTLRNVRWFEVVETRGSVENGKVSQYQVTLKVGFTMED